MLVSCAQVNCWLHASNTGHRSYHNTSASQLPAAQQDKGIPWCGHAGCVHTTYHRMKRTFSCARASPLAFLVSALQLRPFECASCHTDAQWVQESFPSEGESGAGCVHPTQLTAVRTTPALAHCWRRHMTSHLLLYSCRLCAHLMPLHTNRLWPRAHNVNCLSRVTPAAEHF